MNTVISLIALAGLIYIVGHQYGEQKSRDLARKERNKGNIDE